MEKDKNDSILEVSQNYNKINSFLVFITHYLKKHNYTNQQIPDLNKLVELFKNLKKNQKHLYENYSNEFLMLRFKLRDIYDAIHGIKSKTPSGALRIFLQEKSISNEINSIKEGKKLWESLSIDMKESYLSKCHLQFLSFKYKELMKYHLPSTNEISFFE